MGVTLVLVFAGTWPTHNRHSGIKSWLLVGCGSRRTTATNTACLYRVYQLVCSDTCCFVWVWNLVADIEGGTSMRVFENRVLKRIFGSKRDEVPGEYRKLHKQELNDLYYSPNIIRVITQRWWAGHVARMGGDERRTRGSLWGNLRERDHSEDPSVDGRIMFRWSEVGWGAWTGLIWLRVRTGGGHL